MKNMLSNGVFRCFNGTLVKSSNMNVTTIIQKLSSKSLTISAIKLIEKTRTSFVKGFSL